MASRFEFDAFVSYRRSDGGRVARRLRRALLDYRLPAELGMPARPLAVYFDRVYARATDDFFEKTLKPALERSAHLVLVLTPDALAPRADGSPNWVEREVEHFLTLPQREHIHVVIGKGALDAALPAGLAAARPQIQRLDLRSLDRRWSGPGPARWRAEDELLGLMATLHEVPPARMPLLRQEAARVKARRAWSWAAGIGFTALALAGTTVAAAFGWWRASEREAIANSQAMALRAETLKARSMDRAFALALRAYETAPTATAESVLRSHLDSPPMLATAALANEPRALTVSGATERVFSATPDNRGTRVASLGGAPSVDIAGYLLATSADGSRLVTVQDDAIRVHSASDGRTLRSWAAPRAHVQLSGDGRWLALRDDTALHVYDVDSGRETVALAMARDAIGTVAIGPQGDHLVLFATDGTLRWQRIAGGPPAEFTLALKPAAPLAMSADGSLAAVGAEDGTVVLVEPRLLRERGRARPLARPVRHLSFTPDGRHLLVGGDGPGLFALDTATMADAGLRGPLANEIRRVLAWSPDGQLVLAVPEQAQEPVLLAYPEGELRGRISGHSAAVTAAAFSSDGRRLTTVSSDLSARQWAIEDPPGSASVPVPTDGALGLLWLAGDRGLAMAGRRGEVVLWDGLGAVGRTVLHHGSDGVLALAADPAGRLLAGGGHDGRVVVWELPTGTVRLDARVSDKPIESLAFAPDGLTLMVGDRAGRLHRCGLPADPCRVLATVPGGPMAQIEHDAAGGGWRTAGFGSVTRWSPDGKALERHDGSDFGLQRLRWHAPSGTLAFAGRSQRLEVRSRAAGAQGFHLEGLRTGLNDFVFSPSGEQIAVASASTGVRVWSMQTRSVATTLFGLKGSAFSVAWSPDGTRIAATGDGEACLWDAATGARLAAFTGPFGRDARAAFSSDGRRLAIAGRSGRATVVAVDGASLLQAARARARAIQPVLAGTRWDDLWDFGPARPGGRP